MRLDAIEASLLSLKNTISVFDEIKGSKSTSEIVDALRYGVVKAFEICNELCWKAIQAELKEKLGKSFSTNISKKQLFKAAKDFGLIEDAEVWIKFYSTRNDTAHLYSQKKAEAAVVVAKEFSIYAEKLIYKLRDADND
jgi:nucleotidyltransferase substrate binding protein (TIGR01987 family)